MPETTFRHSLGEALRHDTRRRRAETRLIVAGTAVVLAMTVGLTAYQGNHTCGFTDGVTRSGPSGPCWGVTDGSYAFADVRPDGETVSLRDVEAKIREENAKTEGFAYYTIAYWAPMTASPISTSSPASVLHAVQGAYLAQRAANETQTVKVRLVLANPGAQSERWKEVVDRLAGLRDSEHLVAVAGLGTSNDYTIRAIGRLSAQGIPMVGSTITASDVEKIPGFVRIAPSNDDEVAAVIKSLPADLREAALVKDLDPANKYVATLAKTFGSKFKGRGRQVLPLRTSYNGAISNIDGAFVTIASRVCNSPADFVYFAGRGKDLGQFVLALADSCPTRLLRVVTGDDATQLTADRRLADALRWVSVTFTALAAPAQWTVPGASDIYPQGQRQMTDFVGAYGKAFDTAEGRLDDAEAIMAYDSVRTAATAGRPTAQNPEVPGAADVLQGLRLLKDQDGVSGKITIDDITGNAIRKPVVIMNLAAVGDAGRAAPSPVRVVVP